MYINILVHANGRYAEYTLGGKLQSSFPLNPKSCKVILGIIERRIADGHRIAKASADAYNTVKATAALLDINRHLTVSIVANEFIAHGEGRKWNLRVTVPAGVTPDTLDITELEAYNLEDKIDWIVQQYRAKGHRTFVTAYNELEA
jgi:hypothetical protein